MPLIRHVSEREAYARRTPVEAQATVIVVTVLLIAAALIGYIVAALWAVTEANQRGHGTRAEAEVLSVGAAHALTRYPIDAQVRFVDARGRQHVAQASPAFTSMDVQIGQRIPVIYQLDWPTSVRHDDPPWHWVDTLVIAGLATLPLLYLRRFRRRARQRSLRAAQLQKRGVRLPVESVRAYCVEEDGNLSRYTLIASWRDAAGELHETAGGFYARPPSIDAAQLAVLADPADPGNSMIAPDTLPVSTL